MASESQLAYLVPHVQNYTPSQEVLDQVGNVELVTFTGPAGVGKDTLRQALPYPNVVALTTREMRDCEQDGVDYEFYRTPDQLAELASRLASRELVQVKLGPTGDIYGTFASSYPEEGVALFDCVVAQAQEFRTLGFATVTNIFVTTPTFEALFDRLVGRNSETPENILKRLKEGEESLRTGLEDEEFHFVLNDQLAVATHHALEIVEGLDIPASRLKQARNAGATVLRGLQAKLAS